MHFLYPVKSRKVITNLIKEPIMTEFLIVFACFLPLGLYLYIHYLVDPANKKVVTQMTAKASGRGYHGKIFENKRDVTLT